MTAKELKEALANVPDDAEDGFDADILVKKFRKAME